MEYESGAGGLRGAALGAQATTSKVYNDLKQTEGREAMARLSRVLSDLRNTSELASGLANKLVGPRPEVVSPNGAGLSTPPRQDFISELRELISGIEAVSVAINAQLNRVDQTF